MLIPPNYGPRYGQEFRDMFAALAAKYPVAFVPFLLDQVALKNEFMQDDGIHPNAAGQPQMLENLWPELKPLLVAPRQTRKLACDTLVEGSSWKSIGSSRIRRAFALRSMSTSTPRSRR